jgi:hypothetical protein
MAGITTPSLPTFFQDSVLTAARQAEETNPDADWAGGANKAGSNAPGIGIATGDYGYKTSDWDLADGTFGVSQNIGTDNGVNNRITLDQDPDFNDQVVYVFADADTAPGAELDAATGAINMTGETVPAGEPCWGLVAVA